MRIIIAPAKKMNVDTDSLPWRDLPEFLPRTELLAAELKKMSFDELKRLWKCNDSIAELNAQRVARMDLRNNLTPAILAYEGIQYQYMAPGVFSESEFEYAQTHLRILSGFYGMLKPFDGVVPYRLEMQAKMRMGDAKDLYAFWGNSIAESLMKQTDCIVNLASKEYSACVSRHLPDSARMVTCVFGEEQNGKIIEKGTMCKMARGEMVRWMAERNVREPDEIKAFDRLNYRFSPAHSDENTYGFVLRKEKE